MRSIYKINPLTLHALLLLLSVEYRYHLERGLASNVCVFHFLLGHNLSTNHSHGLLFNSKAVILTVLAFKVSRFMCYSL